MQNEEKIAAITSKIINDFFLVANEFCLYMDELEKYNKLDILTYMQKLLPLLYVKGSLLPEVDNFDEKYNERFVTHEQWEEIYKKLKEVLKEDNLYITVHNVDIMDNEPQRMNLAENLTDLYQDLKDFLLLYSKNYSHSKKNALHWVNYYYQTSWGYKLVNIIKMIHTIIYKNQIAANLSELQQ